MLLTLLNPSSPQAESIAKLSLIMLYIAIAIFIVVTVWVISAVIKFRERPGGPKPKKTFGNTRAEVLWTVIPLSIVLFLFVMTVITMIEIDPPTTDTDADLEIIGRQWWWEVHYPKTGVVTANEIHIPVGKKILLRITSADVIHSFWVPALGRKMDAIPGRDNYIYFEASEPGVYHGYCSEFCGTQHAGMKITVFAQPEEEFQKWGQFQLSVPQSPNNELQAKGARLFISKTCYNCHSIAGTGADMSVGPDLTHIASRKTLGSGVVENSRENLALWLKNPAKFKPGSHMPNFQLAPDEVEALVAYLESLK